MYDFKEVSIKDIKSFIETNHYSKSINGCKVIKSYALYYASTLVGALFFGSLSTTAWKKYGEKESDVIELRRLVCLDECPRNTESWFISKALKSLKLSTNYKICVSYADPFYNHCGYIYQATNWNYEGMTASDIVLVTPEGKRYHSRSLRVKYKGEYKPFVKRLREMNDNGLLREERIPGKHIYTYTLDGKHKAVRINYPKI